MLRRLSFRVAALPVAIFRERRSDRGATAVEYALMVMLIAIVIVGAVTALGNNLKPLFDSAASGI